MDIIFDLDGVIINSSASVVNRIKQVAEVLWFDITGKDLTKYIGYSPESTFTDLCNDKRNISKASELYLQLFWQRSVEEATLYPMIERVLQELIIKHGSMLYIVTGRPNNAALSILHYYNLMRYFSMILSSAKRDKSEVVKELIEYNYLDKDYCFYIGDRALDVKAALDNEIIPVGALWGFGSREELVEAGANFLVEKPINLISFLFTFKEKEE